MRALDRLIDAFGALAGFAIAFIGVTVSLEVIFRALGLPPFGWTLEVAEYLLLLATFWGAPWVLRASDHVRIDLVSNALPLRSRAALLRIADAASGLICFTLAYYGARAAFDAFSRGSMLFKYLVIPQWPVLSVMPIGVTLLGLEFLRRAARRQAEAGRSLEGL